MVSWVVAGVVVTDVGLHVCGDVVGCDVNDDRIRVGVQESDVISIVLLEGVVVVSHTLGASKGPRLTFPRKWACSGGPSLSGFECRPDVR